MSGSSSSELIPSCCRSRSAASSTRLVIGIAFMAIGIGGQKAFLGVGAAVLVVGLIYMGKARKGG